MFNMPSPHSIINLSCIVTGPILEHFLMSQWELQYLNEFGIVGVYHYSESWFTKLNVILTVSITVWKHVTDPGGPKQAPEFGHKIRKFRIFAGFHSYYLSSRNTVLVVSLSLQESCQILGASSHSSKSGWQISCQKSGSYFPLLEWNPWGVFNAPSVPTPRFTCLKIRTL